MNFKAIKNNPVFIRCKQKELLQILMNIKRFSWDDHFVMIQNKQAEEIRTRIQVMQEEIEECYRNIYSIEDEQTQEIMMMRYEEGMPFCDIGKQLYMSYDKVKKLHDKAIKYCEGR